MAGVVLAYLHICIILSGVIHYIEGTEVIPERAEVYYFNKKYISNATAYIRRTGRKSPYYMNVEGTTVVTFDNNITLHGVFYEFLHNEYKRSFVELELSLCDVYAKDPWKTFLGEALAARGFICPAPPNTYKFTKFVITMANFPYVWPFERVMLQSYAKHVPSGEIVGTEVIPERCEVYYFNKKYMSNATAYIRRTGRKSPYYMNVEGTTVVTLDNNITLHGVCYEFLHNEYKRSFVELDALLCDVYDKEPWKTFLGDALAARGFICPVPPNTYKFNNLVITMAKFPYVWPFERMMLQAYAKHVLSGEIVWRTRFYFQLKRDIAKGK